jgi:hypothetical protein
LDQTYIPTAVVYSDLIVLWYTFLGILYPFFLDFKIMGFPPRHFNSPLSTDNPSYRYYSVQHW